MERQNEVEIDLIDLFYHLKKRILLIISACVLGAFLGALFTTLFMDDEYTAATRMYVLNRSSDNSISSGDYSVSNYMISDYEVLITGQNVTKAVIEQLNLDMTPKQLTNMISVSAINNTRVLQISVVDTNARRAADIANRVREIASAQIKDIMNVEAVNLVYEAETPQQKSGPSMMKNAMLAAVLATVVVIAVLVVIYMMDDTIRTDDDVERYLGLTVFGVIPSSSEMGALGGTAANTGKNGKKLTKKPQTGKR